MFSWGVADSAVGGRQCSGGRKVLLLYRPKPEFRTCHLCSPDFLAPHFPTLTWRGGCLHWLLWELSKSVLLSGWFNTGSATHLA